MPYAADQLAGTAAVADELARHPVFAAAEPATLQALAAQCHIVMCERRQLLFVFGDEARACFLIRSGHVKLFRESEQGGQAILSIPGPGALFGEGALFNGGTYSASAETVDEANLIAVPLRAVAGILERDHRVCRVMLNHMAGLTLARERDIEIRAMQEAPRRIGCFLLNLCGTQIEGAAVLTLPYEKSIIAEQLGIRAETFSRALLRLQKDLGLESSGQKVSVPDIDALARYTCVSCSRRFPCDSGGP